jgi:hypothetical protein
MARKKLPTNQPGDLRALLDSAEERLMFPCKCGSTTACVDSRPTIINQAPAIRRRRKCPTCGLRFSTIELTKTTQHPPKDLRPAILAIQEAIDELRNQAIATDPAEVIL